jgi:tetratricopeptide (TPR) repeat protein
VSQLFDLLRRDGSPQPRTPASPAARADAVLATLGYARGRHRQASPAIARAVLALAVLSVSWAGWRVYDGSEPARPLARANLPRASTEPQPSNAARRAGLLPPAAVSDRPRLNAEASASPSPAPQLTPAGAGSTLKAQTIAALVNLAIAQRTAGQFDLAEETLLRALALAPRNAAAHYNLGQLYDQTNEPARAVEHYRTFLDTVGAEHASRAAAVRARIAALSRTPE